MTQPRRTGWPLLVALIALPLAGCATSASSRSPAAAADPGLERLADRMTGSFSSAAQAAKDPDFYDIRLEMARIWPERADGAWLYVEQAAADRVDQPYRQRVYRVRRVDDDLFESAVYELPAPGEAVGAWKEPAPLADLSPADLVPRTGCEILLRRQPDGTFEGSTLGRLCPSDLRGASYATSEVVLAEDLLTSWDRGFDASGEQVWGAETGPYRFRKKPPSD
jgi:hypothetical protein